LRRFIPYDQETIYKEMRHLPREDFAALKYAMARYAESTREEILPPAAVADQGSYGEKFKPIFKVRHRSKSYQGRAFFYFGEDSNGDLPMYVLLVYKKEKDEAPRHLVEAAYQRMRRHRGEI